MWECSSYLSKTVENTIKNTRNNNFEKFQHIRLRCKYEAVNRTACASQKKASLTCFPIQVCKQVFPIRSSYNRNVFSLKRQVDVTWNCSSLTETLAEGFFFLTANYSFIQRHTESTSQRMFSYTKLNIQPAMKLKDRAAFFLLPSKPANKIRNQLLSHTHFSSRSLC